MAPGRRAAGWPDGWRPPATRWSSAAAPPSARAWPPSPSGSTRVTGGSNDEAAGADLVIVTVPYEGHADLLASLAGELAGKIVVDCVNPLGFDKHGPYALAVADGSAAQEAQRILPRLDRDRRVPPPQRGLARGPGRASEFDEDVLVLGEDRDAVGTVIELATRASRVAAASSPADCATPIRWRP